jgi:hypothetical protein
MTVTGGRPVEVSGPAHRYLVGLRIGVTAVAGTLLLTMSMLRNVRSYDPAWTQPVAWLVLAGVVAAGAGLLIRHRPWGRSRQVVITAILIASATSMLGLPDGAATTAADWSTGVVGWVGLVVLFDRPLAVFVAFLAVHEAMVLTDVLVTRPGDVDALLNALSGAIGTLGYPLAGAIAATALASAARTVERSWQESEQLRTTEAIAARLHAGRRDRFAALDDGVLPMLRALRDGTADPTDPQVRRACSIEAARLRRLFAESEDSADPLLHVVRHCVDVAERRRVVVELQVSGQWPDPPGHVRRALTDGLLVVVSTAASWVRVTVIGADGVLTVGAVADSGPVPVAVPAGTVDVVVDTIKEGELIWVQARWTMP